MILKTENGMVGLVLAGGGGKGPYELGVWKALFEYNLDKEITHVSGTSVGALNAALFAQGDYFKAEKIWKSINPEVVLKPKGLENLKQGLNFFKNAGLVGIPVATLNELKKILSKAKAEGVFSTQGLAKIIDEEVNLSTISLGAIVAYATCVKKEGWTKKYFKLNDQPIENIKNIVLASSSLPFVFDSYTIEGDEYVDGGIPKIGDNIPIQPLYDEGVRFLIVVHLSQDGLINCKDFPDATIIEITPQEDQGDLFTGTLDFSPEGIERRITQGYLDAKRILEPMVRLSYSSQRTVENISKILHAEKEHQIQSNKHNNKLQEESKERNDIISNIVDSLGEY